VTTRHLILAGLLGLLTAGGCTKTFLVDRYPPFHDPKLKTVAVMPFDSTARHRGAGRLLAQHLAAALTANGSYAVIGPDRLRGMLGAEKLDELVRASDADVARALASTGKIDAFITGAALAYDAHAAAYLVPDDPPGYWHGRHSYRSRRRHGPYYYGPVYATEYVTSARVMVTAAMVRARDAAVLATTPVPVGCEVSLSGYSPRSAGRALDRSAIRVMEHLVGRFAIVPVEVRVKPGEDFRITTGRPGHGGREAKEFATADKQMAVIVHLPPEADRNEFRLAITPKDTPGRVLAARTFTWARTDGVRVFDFDPSRLAAEAGPGEYRVRFLTRGKEVMHRDVRIR